MKEGLTCTAYERRGFVLLIGLILLGNVAGRWMPVVLGEKVAPADIDQWNALIAQLEQSDSTAETARLFPFDPNTATQRELETLGLPEWIAARVVKYREAGGRFRTKADLQRIYGFSEADYQRLEAYIQLPGTPARPRMEPRETIESPEVRLKPRYFDPNAVRQDELVSMGLPERVAQTWVNYRQAGGRFFRPDDLDKLYGLKPEWAAALKPYVRLKTSDPPRASVAENPMQVDINTASPEEWRRLRGIGKVYSERIVRFREALGGFSHIGQVAHTYGLPDSTFQAIRTHLILKKGVYRKLPLNSASVEDFAAHPYLSKRQAAAIAAYRQHHGPFQRVDEVNKTMVLSQDEFEKLQPYLSLK